MARRRSRRLRKRSGRGKGKSRVGTSATQQTIKAALGVLSDPTIRKTIQHAGSSAANYFKNKTKVNWQKRRQMKVTYGGVYNIKADQERKTYTYYKQKVTKLQQKKINSRFRKDASQKYIITNDYQFVDTIPQQTNNTKWLWVTHNTFDFISKSFSISPEMSTGQTNDSLASITNSFSRKTNKDQAIYFNKFKSVYEIFNPCNYDMNVVVYDVVCKKDTHSDAKTMYASSKSVTDAETYYKGDPISLMYHGTNAVKGPYPQYVGGNNATVQVSDNMTGSIYDIAFKPTESYAFNMHWTIVGKKKIRLQPGATMEHHFTYKAKNLMNRGYYAYQYADIVGAPVSSQAPNGRGIENLTCGTLFKIWGQISGSTLTKANPDSTTAAAMPIIQDNPNAVVNLSGRFMIKENYKQEYYLCNPKVVFTQHATSAVWQPTDEESLGVPTTVKIEEAQDDLNGPNNTMETDNND